MKKLSNQKGFTLIELMIVVAIIGILAAVAIPQYQNFTKKSKASEAKVVLDGIITAEAAYFAENDNFTHNLSDLGNPQGSPQYYRYGFSGSPNSTAVTVVATPSNTAGVPAGLASTWTIIYNGRTGNKTTVFPSKGW